MNEKLMIFAVGMFLGAMFKTLLMVAIVLGTISFIGYIYVKRSKLAKYFSKS